jgi:hypothetical protein
MGSRTGEDGVSDDLRTEHQELRRAVPAARRAAHKIEGKLGAAFREAMEIWDRQKADGVSFLERLKGLDALIRDVWPKGECSCPRCRWVCQSCQDTGANYEKRPARIYGGMLVEYVVPCACERGRRFMEKPKADPGDFTQAARSKPRTTMTRMGR